MTVVGLPPPKTTAPRTAAVPRSLRDRNLDDYLAAYEQRKGPLSAEERERARQLFDETLTP
jgi:hypothetical protein